MLIRRDHSIVEQIRHDQAVQPLNRHFRQKELHVLPQEQDCCFNSTGNKWGGTNVQMKHFLPQWCWGAVISTRY